MQYEISKIVFNYSDFINIMIVLCYSVLTISRTFQNIFKKSCYFLVLGNHKEKLKLKVNMCVSKREYC